jgi:hypothetical protein
VPGETFVARYRGQSWYARFYAIALLFVCLFIGIAVLTAKWSGFSIYLLVLAGVTASFVFLAKPFWKNVTISESAVRMPFRFRSITVPLKDIGGVGLVFTYWPFGTGYRTVSGWSLVVWRSDMSRYDNRAIMSIPVHVIENGTSKMKWGGIKPRRLDEAYLHRLVTTTDLTRLAGSAPGMIATAIYEHALRNQGPTGPLATLQLQKKITWSNADPAPLSVAYWSPDGEIGSAHWASERESPENPPVGWANR